MDLNWSSVPDSSVNYDDSGSISNTHPDIFPTPEQSIPEGSDYGWFPNSSFPGVNYMEGLGSARKTGMMYGGYQETAFSTMNLDNSNNILHSTVLPPSSFFNSNAHAVHGMHFTISVGTPIYGHADVHAQAPNFGLDLNLALDPALTIPTSTMPNIMPLLTSTLLPSTPTAPIITTATPMTVADYGHDYGHDAGYDCDINHDTPAPELPEQEPSASASRPRERNRRRVYRTSYDNHASHRYTCHPCRFSTDVKRDFARHEETSKHRRKQGQHQDQQQEEIIHQTRGQRQREDGEEEKEEQIRRMG